MSGKEIEPEKLTVRQLFVNVKVGHLWGIIVVVAGLLIGSFQIGSSLESSKGKEMTKRMNEMTKKMNEMTKKINVYEIKTAFISDYLSYLINERKLTFGFEDVNEEIVEMARNRMVSRVADLWKGTHSSIADHEERDVYVGKDLNSVGYVWFNDKPNIEWFIFPEIKKKVHTD